MQDCAAQATRLREAQIPQHVGMAAASRALAADLPRVLTAELEADLRSGALATRFEAACARATKPASGVRVEPTLAAVIMLMAEQAKRAARYLGARGDEWAADAYRLEGQAAALEAQSNRLSHIAAAASSQADKVSRAEPETTER